jgi:hypothetical protein
LRRGLAAESQADHEIDRGALREPFVADERAPGGELERVSDRSARPLVAAARELVAKGTPARLAPGCKLRNGQSVAMEQGNVVFHPGVPTVERT